LKFIYADSIDTVDPGYDFILERNAPSRDMHWDDRYPHEFLAPPPYDGIRVSRGIVGDHRFPGKYTPSQAMRFRRLGARKFLRLDGPATQHMPIFGDCGAFSYVNEKVPPYTPTEILDFYADGGFTHGCSVDHIIFDFDREESGPIAGSEDARLRFDITLENAREFIRLSPNLGAGFTPIGVVQAWSPSSLAEAAVRLEGMGYTYLAIGGLVPLRADDIHRCIRAIRDRISSSTRLHLLGFAKSEEVGKFASYGIASFDSTSPLLRAFKDARSNYYVSKPDASLDFYTAIRIPQAIENNKLLRAVKEGKLSQERLLRLESVALAAVRRFDRDEVPIEAAVEAVAEYGSLLAPDPREGSVSREKLAAQIRIATQRTLADRPWKSCNCAVCAAISIEVMIFRSSNRNKRRGFHNLEVFYHHVCRLLNKDPNGDHVYLSRRTG
jgi:hypothetical protein